MALILHYYDSVDSTMDQARQLLEKSFERNLLTGVLAKEQLKGRGRQGRSWISPEGNLYLTLMLEAIDPQYLTQYSLLWGLALKQALQELLIDRSSLHCKWPNDILLEEKKVGGLLIERFSHNNQEAMLVGIGVNISTAPTDTVFPAISLENKLINTIRPDQLAKLIYDHFRHLYFKWHVNGFDFIRQEWLKVAWKLGEEINIRQNDGSVIGVFEMIDPFGAILIKDRNGHQHKFYAGDVFRESINVTGN